MMLSARALLDRTPNPTRAEIKQALAGNLCRCTGYTQIVEAVELAIADAAGTPPTPPHWARFSPDGAAPRTVSRPATTADDGGRAVRNPESAR
jgi:xanthine dehydrogenase iron-sulfur cluster and FAD-binding subunit A